MQFEDALKLIKEDNLLMRANFWPKEDYVAINPQKPDQTPNKNMLIKYTANKTRSFAWTPDQVELLDDVWEKYDG